MDWIAALLTESPDQSYGLKASFQARFVVASLLYRNREAFAGNLNGIAKEVGLKASFFRRGVEELIQLGWLEIEHDIQSRFGPSGRIYRISEKFQKAGCRTVGLADWQIQTAEVLLFTGGKQVVGETTEPSLPSRVDTVLAVLILSASQSGFVCDLSKSEVADRSGVALSGLSRYCKQLEKMGRLVQFPGGAGKKINGTGWLVKTVYQINFLMIAQILPNKHLRKPRLVHDDVLSHFPLRGGLLSVWPSIISDSVPQGDEAELFLENTQPLLFTAIPSVINKNLLARLLSATSYLISCKEFRAELIGMNASGRNPSRFQLSRAIEIKMMNKLLQNKAVGGQFGLGLENHTYEDLIEGSNNLSDQGAEYGPLLLITLRLCIFSLRLAAYLYKTDEFVSEDVHCVQGFLYAITWLPKSKSLLYSLIETESFLTHIADPVNEFTEIQNEN